jgi:hypothetical protein
VKIRLTAKRIDQVALLALIALIISYSYAAGVEGASSSGVAWLVVSLILLLANALRLAVGARPSESGVVVGASALILALLRITGAVQEVTLIVASATIVAPLLLLWLLRSATKVRARVQ